MVPRDTLLTGHSIVIRDQQISDLMPTDAARLQYPDAPETLLEQHIVVPGFINVHGHAAMTLLRGLADDREMMDWLTNWIWPIEAQLVSEQFVYDGTRLAALEMLMSGTTCAADTYFFPEAAARAFTDMGLRAQVAMPVLQFGNAWARDEEDHIHKGLAFRDTIRNSQLISSAFAPHSPYSVSDEGFKRVRLYSEQLDVPIHLHLHETATEVSDAVTETGMRPIERLRLLGLITPALQAVHMTQLRDDEIRLLATNGVHIAHCPESNMKLASGICRVTELREQGINVAIGTDGAASNNDLDMLQEARSASMLAKVASADATSLNAFEALEMMTINGAKLLGLDDVIGTIEIGKLADLTAIDLSGPTFAPMYNPLSQLIYTATGRDVSDVWVNGEHRVKARQLAGDINSILGATAKWQQKIANLQAAT